MTARLGHIIAFAMLVWFGAVPSMANERVGNGLVADVSKDSIAIQFDFKGDSLLLFGAVEPIGDGLPTDVAIVLRGPGENFLLRKKQRVFGIWVNALNYAIGPLPGFYALVSSRPIGEIAAEEERRLHELGSDYLRVNALQDVAQTGPQSFEQAIAAFIRIKQSRGLFIQSDNGVEIMDGRLFRAEIKLPSGMPVGTYVTEFFAFHNGRLVGYQTGEIPVDIVGAGQVLHSAAFEQPFFYGLGGVIIALLMGWLVAAMFRRV